MSSLYLDYFGLTLPPFSITPDPSFFFEGKDKGVFSTGLMHATLQSEGIVLVIGEVGCGKTLMSRILLSRLPSHVDTVYLPNPAFSRDEIIEVIARDLGVNIPSANQGALLEILQQELLKRHMQGRQVVVLIDETHTMPAESIEEVRRLSNLETGDRKLVQIVLFGQPELNTLLEAPHLRQVRDRVVYRLNLQNLSKEDAIAYLEHRLRVAGWRGGRMFSWSAQRCLLNDAKGRARRINLLADKALLAAYADQTRQVKLKHVQLAIRDIGPNFSTTPIPGGQTPRTNVKWLLSLLAAVMVSAASAAYLTIFLQKNAQPRPANLTNQHGIALTGISQTNHAPPPNLAKTATLLSSTESKTSTPATSAIPTAPAAPVKSATPVTPAASTEKASQAAITTKQSNKNKNINLVINQRIKQSFQYAQEQAKLGHYTIQVATIRIAADVDATELVAAVERSLPPGKMYIKRSTYGIQMQPQRTRLAIYFSSFPTLDAAKAAIATLPEKSRTGKPIIRSWKEICDVPWQLQ